MDGRRSDIEDYARRRLKLAGYAILPHDHPYFAPLDRLKSETAARGDAFVSFANYDYLGLSADTRLRDVAVHAVEQFGIGAGASRLVGGERTSHRALEYDLASFLGHEDSLALVSGYGLNVSVLGHMLGKGDLILMDDLSHNSISVGTSLSRATVLSFAHNDLDDLERLLVEKRSHFKRVLVVVEGLYSMDGDVPDLPRLIALKDRFDAWLMVDEAHSIGVLGKTGRGVAEHFGIAPDRIDIVTGTLSKTFVSCGGFVTAKQSVIDWLRFTLPGFVYSVGLSPVITAAVREALAIIEREPFRVTALRANARHFVRLAHQLGFNTGEAIGEGVVPIVFDSAERTMWAARALMRSGFYVPPIVQIGVPKEKPRLRFFLTAAHTREQIDGVLHALSAAMRPGVPSAELHLLPDDAPVFRDPAPADARGATVLRFADGATQTAPGIRRREA